MHSETSTGVLNDLNTLKNICLNKGKRLCLDCVSSVGIVPVDLSDVYLASGVSGKGLASYSGLSFVFYNHEILPISDTIPRYLDIGLYAESKGIPFTISSNLVYALSAALKAFENNNKLDQLKQLSDWVRAQVKSAGFRIVARDDVSSPALITIPLPDWVSSSELGQRLQDEGFLLHWRSNYLLEKNWIQIALMGECVQDHIKPLFDLLPNLDKRFDKAL